LNLKIKIDNYKLFMKKIISSHGRRVVIGANSIVFVDSHYF